MADLDTMLDECEQIYIDSDTECTDCTSVKLGEIASTICQANKILDDKFRHDKLELKVVMELPDEPEYNTIYLVPRENEEEDNIYEEYVWINGEWEKVGSSTIDLSEYYTKEETEAILADYLKSDDFCATLETCEAITVIQDSLDEKQDKLTAGTNITISDDNVISSTGGGAELTKEAILNALGYEEIEMSMTDDEGVTNTWTILAKADEGGELIYSGYGTTWQMQQLYTNVLTTEYAKSWDSPDTVRLEGRINSYEFSEEVSVRNETTLAQMPLVVEGVQYLIQVRQDGASGEISNVIIRTATTPDTGEAELKIYTV